MRAILPGRPSSKRQALTTAHWDGLRIVAYISGNAAIIATDPHIILQTIYIDNVEALTAVTIEEISGRIALCDEKHVYVYDAVGRDEGLLRWTQTHDLTKNDEDIVITTLSWSSPEELLVGGSRLLLWYISENNSPQLIWNQILPYPTAFAYVSHDGGLIASCGQHDRLIKVWRRLSFEVDSTRFDVSYLPHPAAVTNVHWRKPWHAEQNLDSLLYTFCSDQKVRIWAHPDPHGLRLLQQVAEIDMNVSIQPRRLSVGSVSHRRYAFVVDSRDFSSATEKAVQNGPSSGIDHALEHLIEIARRSPEICIIVDGIGHLSAWGIENAGNKQKNLFNATIGDGLNISLPQQDDPVEDYYQFCVFGGGTTKSSLSLLVHSFSGSISWYDAQITNLFDTSSRQNRARLLSSWTGHDGTVEKFVRDSVSKNVCTWTNDGDIIVWRYNNDPASAPLLARGFFDAETAPLDAQFSMDGRFLIVLWPDKIVILQLKTDRAIEIIVEPIADDRDPTNLLPISYLSGQVTSLIFGILYDDQKIDIWQAYPQTKSEHPQNSNGTKPLRPITTIDRPSSNGKSVMFPAASLQPPGTAEKIDYPSDQTVYTITMHGDMEAFCWVPSSEKRGGSFSRRLQIPTTMRKSTLASGIDSGKVAVVAYGGKDLVIWDTLSGTFEYQFHFDGPDIIEKLSWSSTKSGCLLLAVGFAFNVVVFGQLRYSATNSHNAWSVLHTIRTRDFTTHAIGDICLLEDDVLISAGSQVFVVDLSVKKAISTSRPRSAVTNSNLTIQQCVSVLNAQLPIMHPDLLSLLLTLGKSSLVNKILNSLHAALKYFSDGDALSSTLSFRFEDFEMGSGGDRGNTEHSTGVNLNNHAEEDSELVVTDETTTRLQENLAKIHLPNVLRIPQTALSNLSSVARDIAANQKSIDQNGLRYLQELYSHQKGDLPWRAIMFATLSTSQEALVGLVTQFYGGKLTWEHARQTGMFLWLSEREAVQAQLENVARSEYTKHEDRNPVDCSLHYLALGKKNVLQGLWRMTIGIRERENTLKLLANNFNDARWKATALKNAYALISKRRFEYAAAFFLLGNSLKDAVNVCVHQMGDLQLAIAITKAYHDEEESHSVLKILISKSVLRASVNSVEARWMAAWGYHNLGDIEKAVQVIVRPVHVVVGSSLTEFDGIPGSLNYLANDPTITVLYQQLRSTLASKNKWSEVVSPREEWNFVLRCVRHYMRMGCDILALGLVQNWDFIAESKQLYLEKDKVEPRPAQSATEPHKEEEVKLTERKEKKPAPTSFQEPSASSLLDSFGF